LALRTHFHSSHTGEYNSALLDAQAVEQPLVAAPAAAHLHA
jgi:hypothetical protein